MSLIGKGKILVMDDEEDVIEVVTKMLVKSGYEVETSKDGTEAIELYNKAREIGKPFDAVILDLIVPGGMGGEKTIKKLFEIDPDVKALVSSGYSDDKVTSEFKKFGFISFLSKPYKINEIDRIIQKTLKG